MNAIPESRSHHRTGPPPGARVPDGPDPAHGTEAPTRLAPQEDELWNALRQVLDPEAGIDVVTLGLVYDLIVRGNEVTILYTLTTPHCPLGAVLERDITSAVAGVAGVASVQPILVFDPPWSPDFIQENA